MADLKLETYTSKKTYTTRYGYPIKELTSSNKFSFIYIKHGSNSWPHKHLGYLSHNVCCVHKVTFYGTTIHDFLTEFLTKFINEDFYNMTYLPKFRLKIFVHIFLVYIIWFMSSEIKLLGQRNIHSTTKRLIVKTSSNWIKFFVLLLRV